MMQWNKFSFLPRCFCKYNIIYYLHSILIPLRNLIIGFFLLCVFYILFVYERTILIFTLEWCNSYRNVYLLVYTTVFGFYLVCTQVFILKSLVYQAIYYEYCFAILCQLLLWNIWWRKWLLFTSKEFVLYSVYNLFVVFVYKHAE